MSKRKSTHVCTQCGTVHGKWSGRCEGCGEWNTVVEETAGGGVGGGPSSARPGTRRGRVFELSEFAGSSEDAPRTVSGMPEVDRVLGGGFVRGAAVLIGGEPGIGKSTLLAQVSASLARRGERVVYISGEEAVAQVRLRADRLGLADAPVKLASETSVEDIVATLEAGPCPTLVIVDSIQTLWTDAVESAPGTVAQVRTASQALIGYAKRSGASVVMVGHVTKDGNIAGPRVVEHMVDAVLFFEGDGAHRYRILRGIKNRFGPTSEIGVFEMVGEGLREVANPSELFLGDRDSGCPGTAVFAGMEGTRPVLVEIQALVAPSQLSNPRRAVVGWDTGRLSMIIAVLEAHCGVGLGQHDVYLNVAGGLRVGEPAADLAVAAALVSSLSGIPGGANDVVFGEVSLSGSVRPVPHAQARLREAAKLGFTGAVAPVSTERETDATGIRPVRIAKLSDLVARIAANVASAA